MTIVWLQSEATLEDRIASSNSKRTAFKKKHILSLGLDTGLSTLQTSSNLVLDLSKTNDALILSELDVTRRLPLHEASLLPFFGLLVLLIDVLARHGSV